MTAPPGFFAPIDRLRAELNGLRPLPAEEARQLRDYFRVGLTYSSNALEGNSLDLIETRIVIEEGITIGGKPVRDHLEAIGHAEAYDHLLTLAEKNALREADLRELHRLFFARIDPAEAGQYRRIQVYLSGSEFLPPAPDRVPGRMRALFRGLAKQRRERHPVGFAAWLHYELVSTHPFIDGNGRTARLAMNLALLQAGYPVVSIPPVRRGEYLRALEREQTGRLERYEDSFEALIADLTQSSLHEYLRLVRR